MIHSSFIHQNKVSPLLGRLTYGTLLLLLLTLALPSIPVRADGPFDDEWGYIGTDLKDTYSVAWGDVDGDGDLDLAVGNGGSLGYVNQVFENEGGMLSPSPLWESADAKDTYSVAWGDVDGDGDLDLAVGNSDSYSGLYQVNQVFENVGGVLSQSPLWESDPDDAGKTYSVAWGDVDGDGDLDLAVGNRGQVNQVFENEGGMLSTSPLWESSDAMYTESVAWGDVDGDGDLDLAVGNWYQVNQVFENEGGMLSLSPLWESNDAKWTTSVAWGDVDGDGDLDFAVGNYNQAIQVFENEGGMLSPSPLWESADAKNAVSVAWGDVDGDGDLDLAIGNRVTNQVFENEGGMLSTSPWWESNDPMPTNTIALGDVDGDGDLDLAVGNSGANQVYKNTGGTLNPSPRWESVPDNDMWTTSIAWGDVDGDGDLDLAVGNDGQGSGQVNQVFENVEGVLRPSPLWESADTKYTTSVAWGDVDGDGDLDLAVGNTQRVNQVFENVCGGLNPSPLWESADAKNTRSVAWGDVDGDGDLDFAVGNYNQANQVFENEGGMLSPSPLWESADAKNTLSVAWGDVDGDGDLDLAIGNSGANQMFENKGGLLNQTPLWESADAKVTRSLAWGDVDGDGDLDLAVGNDGQGSGQVNQVFENVGGMLSPFPLWESAFYDIKETYSVAWGDADGDGDLDLAVGNWYDVNQVFENEEGMLRPSPLWESADTKNTASVAWGDVDDDGDLDLAVGNTNQINQVFENVHQGGRALPSNAPSLALTAPSYTYTADFYASAIIIDNSTIPITYTLFDPEGDMVGNVQTAYSPGGGGHWLPAIATTDTITMHLSTGYWLNSAVLTPTQTIPNTGIPFNVSTLVTDNNSIAEVQVWLSIMHTDNADLAVTLRSPLGTRVPLFTTGQASGQNLAHTRFADSVTTTMIISGSAPYTGTYHPVGNLADFKDEPISGTWTLVITDSVGGGSGMLAAWGLRIKTPPVPHVFEWDIFASGFFGQSDNVVFRMVAHPQPATSAVTGTYKYYNHTPLFQRPYASATTFPFRVRGTQVQVYSETIAISNTVANALVYRQPTGQVNFTLMGSAGQSFRTHPNGYLQGQGELGLGDHLVALLPITHTENYTLYHTSARPALAGLNAYTVTEPGVQELVVSAANPLLLFNLDVSLEWDARQDTIFLDQLQYDLQRTSELLYDWSNGQAVLGDITLYHNREHWLDADVQILASNRFRPYASKGGVVSEVISDTDVISVTYEPGSVRIGSVWNRFGEATGSLGEDWPRALAHELGHYLFFLDDNYLGLDTDGLIVPVDTCTGSAMSDPYREDYSEFHGEADWDTDCAETLAAQTTGRWDWQTLTTFYPWLHAEPANPGPSGLPLALPQIHVVEPVTPSAVLAVPVFYLTQDGAQVQPGVNAQAFLFKGDQLVDLGGPALDQVHARGAEPGDRVCVYELGYQTDASRLGCEDIRLGDEELALTHHTDWLPEVVVSPVNSRTVAVEVVLSGLPATTTLSARLYPASVAPPLAQTLVAGPVSGTYTTTFHLAEPEVEAYVHLWVNEPEPRREVVVNYSLGGNPARGRSLGYARGRSLGYAPGVSADGQVILFGGQQFDEGEFYALQAATRIPQVPAWATIVGQGYWLRTSAQAPSLEGTSINFKYLERQVPPGEEAWLRIYRWDGVTWTQVPTRLDQTRNFAFAPATEEGLYVLMSSLEIRLSDPGWNMFAYPVQGTRPVTDALLSISGHYTVVYDYVGSDIADPWKFYSEDVPGWAFDLHTLEFGQGYWINVSQPITLYLKGASQVAQTTSLSAVSTLPSPPASYYGYVFPSAAFTPSVGMFITATIGGAVCGQGRIRQTDGAFVYMLDVLAATERPGCGTPGKPVRFAVAGQAMAALPLWGYDQLWKVDLSPWNQQRIYLPVILKP